MATADPVQLRYVGDKWKELIDYVTQVARAMGTVCTRHGSVLLFVC